MSCVFCTDRASAGELLFEDTHAWVILHPDWSPRGHLMIVAKHHAENASDLDAREWLQFAQVWHRAERILLEVTKADRAIVMKLGLQTPHLHVHLYPVTRDATRADVYEAIDGKHASAPDPSFVTKLREQLT
jgi:diadenosine tetraphosphate (Ap4A) HIT family hydrolase